MSTVPLATAIAQVEAAAGDPSGGKRLPLPVFLMITRLVPLFTVDLLIQDAGRILLTWRDDEWFGAGWHLPGSAVRYKETIAARLQLCADEELGATVALPQPLLPLAVEEEIDAAQRTRGHNIALLYPCRLLSGPDPAREADPARPQPGQWAWHATCPADMLPVHRRYARLFTTRSAAP